MELMLARTLYRLDDVSISYIGMERINNAMDPKKTKVSISYIGMELQHLVVITIIAHIYRFVKYKNAKNSKNHLVNLYP